MEQKYCPRLADRLLQSRLQSAGAVLIEGPKWCGKTSTARRAARSTLYMQDPGHTREYLLAADLDPSLLLEGAVPRLIDEWQMADDSVMHSGTGRFARMMMRPMSLFESGESSGQVSLEELFEGQERVRAISDLSVASLSSVIARGGWPASVGEPEEAYLQRAVNYIDMAAHTDISRVDDIRRDPQRVYALLRSLARNTGRMASIASIRTDISLSEGGTEVNEKTITRYMRALSRIFVTEDMQAWNPVLRSKTAIRTSPKRYFVDPSLPVAVFALTPKRLLKDLQYFGFLFESLCVRDLRIYAQAIDGHVYHYQDKNALEADAVVVLRDGRWGAAEIKLGSREIEKGAANLLKLRRKIDTEKMQAPSFLMVLTGGQYGFTREDGVHIVPVGTLRS